MIKCSIANSAYYPLLYVDSGSIISVYNHLNLGDIFMIPYKSKVLAVISFIVLCLSENLFLSIPCEQW